MATTKSKKALCHLVCQASSDISEEVLKQELERNLSDLKNGVLCFAKPTAESLAAFTSNKKVANKLTQFILELSKLINVEESASKNILQTYLAGDFRGTKDSLKKLVNDERCQKPLLTDIWHFFQAEKLYNLHVLKAILTQASNNHPTFMAIFAQLDSGNDLKASLFKQLKFVMESSLPEKDKYFNQEMINAWIHFNLRQQSELLQILLLYFHNKNSNDPEDILDLLKLFTNHKFGTHKLDENIDKSLQDSIGHLESLLIVYLLDLPALTEDMENIADWKNPTLIKDLDKNIGSNLGNLKPHGPPMLAWMLAHYVINPAEMNKFQHLGQTAFDLKVIEYLSCGLENDALNANNVISAIAHGVIYSLLSILLTAFDPSRMPGNIFNLVLQVIKKDVISKVIWKEGLEQGSGVSGYLGTALNESPVDNKDAVKSLTALAKSGSKTSADNVFDYLTNKDIFAEPVEDVPSHFIDIQANGNFVNLVARHKGVLVLSNGLQGVLSNDGKYYLWKFHYNGFKNLFHTIDTLLGQVVRGAKNISQDTLEKVIDILQLMEVLSKSTLKMNKHEQMMKNLCLSLIDKFIQVPNPPIRLLAGCLRCLSTCLDDQVWKCLTDSGFFPYMNNRTDLNPGVIGTLLAQQECVLGQYPMTSAWLELLLAKEYHHYPSSLFVVEEILPSYQNWRFLQVTDQQILGQKVLQVCSSCHEKVLESLMKPLPNQTLINIASIGDRIIQSCYEAQTTSERGLGVEMAKLVMLGLELLNKLLMSSDQSNAGQLGKVIGSSDEPHFLLIVAHYIYHLQTPGLALSSIRFLSTVSSMFPMSLLACLGNDAEALRDILIHRLESQTEDVGLKIAILKFFTASVKSQPGLIQLLLNHQDGCLKSVMILLQQNDNISMDLHLTLVEFIYNLWSHSCALAISHLKTQDDFWSSLTWPLFENESKLSIKVNAFILRIISTEIFAFKSNVDQKLIKILEKLFDDKHIQNWCQLMVTNAGSSSDQDQSILSVDEQSSDIGIFLMSSWKTLLIVLSKDQPIHPSPKVCFKITNSLIKAIRKQLVSMQDINMRMITSLSETCLILMQRWLTKCAGDSMTDFMSIISSLMEEFVACYETLHPRVRIAILGIASTALKTSAFKLEDETQVLTQWLPSASSQVEKALLGQGDPKEAVLALGLLRGLLQRLPDVQYWFPILHQKSILMSILSHCHHNLRAGQHPEVIQASFGLLLTLSKSQQGCHALLSTDLSQLIWLPLSSINKKLDQEWILVFTLALQLTLHLIQVGQQHALEHVLTVVALLQDQLMAFLIGPKNGNLEKNKMDLTTVAASLIGHCMVFYKQWQIIHPSSLSQFYKGMTSLLHTSACLLIRPSLLHMVINKSNALTCSADKSAEQELQRVRRLSSTEHDSNTDTCPETVHVQNRLLCSISSCFRMLIALSPDLVALVTDDILDTDAHEQLLNIGFSTPAFEQAEQDPGLLISYGTIISICNFCIRTMTLGKSDLDRKKLLMVLEQGLTVMLAQALLCLSNDNLSSRDKQLLRRELGAELGSVNETMRRFVYRSATKSPQNVVASPTSSTTSCASNTSGASRLNKSDEQFMKFVSNIVQKVFK